jgi:large subunit ribosomal protein L28
MLTGKKANNGYTVSFSHRRTKTLQQANLQYKRVYWEREERWIRLRISTNAMKTIEKIGLEAMAEEAGLDLYSLRHEDASASRREWLAANPGPPMPKNKRQPKFRPLGVPKTVFVPAWKKAAIEALKTPAEKTAALTAWTNRWFKGSPVPASA